MPDRIAQYVISLGGDDGDLRSAFGRIKSQMRSDVAELESITNKVDLFSAISDNIPKVSAAIDKAKAQIAQLNAEIKKIEDAGGKAPKALTDALAEAEKAAKSATTEFNRQSQQVATLQSALQRAGVDTKNLASEQTRLAAASKAASDAAAVQAAKQTLGLTTLKDIQPLVDKLGTAYTTLQKSGTLSATEIQAAQLLLQKGTTDLHAQVTTLPTVFGNVQNAATSFFSNVAVRALATVGSFAAIAGAIKTVIDAAREYEQGLAEIGSVTRLTKDQLGDLGQGARTLSVELGIDLNAALKGLYELIRSGVPSDNALEVLRAGAIAAKAALTDTGSGVKAANLLISAYGADVKDVAGDLDILVQSQKSGGATLKEFADGAGPLLNIARSLHIPLTEVVAVLGVMTNASGDAAGSIGDLTKILVKLGEPTVIAQLRGLGIQTGDLVTTLQQLGQNHLALDQVLALGVGSTKSAAGVAALTNNVAAIAPALDAANKAAGTAEKTVTSFFDSPKERSDRFNAAIKEAEVNLGELFGSGSRVAQVGTAIVSVFNQVATSYGNVNKESRDTSISVLNTADAFDYGSDHADRLAAAAKKTAIEIKNLSGEEALAAKNMRAATESLVKDVADLQAITETRITEINKTAQDQIDTLVRAEQQARIVVTDGLAASTAAATTAIEAQLRIYAKASVAAQTATAEIVTVAKDVAGTVASAADAERAGIDDLDTRIQRLSQQTGKSLVELYTEVGSAVTLTNANIAAAEDSAAKASERAIASAVATIKGSADAILRAQIELAKERLAVIEKNYAATKKLTDDAIAGEIEARRKGGELTKAQEAQLQVDIARIRLASIQPTIAQFQALYDNLIAQEQGYANKLQQLGHDRLAFNQGIEKQLFDIRIGALSSFDQYIAKSKEADRLVSLSRQAADIGDAENAKKYGDQAIGIANSLGVTYSVNGKIIVSQTQAQADKLRILKDASDAVNSAYENAGSSAEKGYNQTKEFSDKAKRDLDDVLAKQKESQEIAEKGLKVRVDIDQASFDSAKAKLDELTAPRTVSVSVQSTGDAAPSVGSTTGGFNRGGYVPQGIQGFATGGPVFQRPNWSKVPGMGDTDSVPALLREGSFVVRKAASSYYGDGLMSTLAQAFASGGPVGSGERYAFFNKYRDIQLTPAQLDALSKDQAERAAAANKLSSSDADTVIDYAQAVIHAGGSGGATAGVFGLVIEDIRSRIKWVAEHPADTKEIAQLLKSASQMGSNLFWIDYYGKTAAPTKIEHQPLFFEDWLKQRKDMITAGYGFAGGGPVGTDMVPAWLTPEEWVVPPEAAKFWGGGFLEAINNMNVPRPSLAGLSLAPPTMPRYFASGGPVGNVPDRGSMAMPGAGGDLHVHINGAQFDLNNQSDVRRLLYQIDEIRRRTGKASA